MTLLLDTHAMYWYIEGDPQLSASAAASIQDLANEILISPASYWEIAIKLSIGKWRLNRRYEEFIELGLNRYGFKNTTDPTRTHVSRGWIAIPAWSQRPIRPIARRSVSCRTDPYCER